MPTDLRWNFSQSEDVVYLALSARSTMITFHVIGASASQMVKPMKRIFPRTIRLLSLCATVIVVLAATGCASDMQSPKRSGSPTPVSSMAARATAVKPASSVSANAASASGGTAIPFQTLAQGLRLSSAPAEPALHMAADAASLAAVALLVDPQDQTLLKTVDLKSELVLAAFWGRKPSGGFSITIDSIFISGADLIVNVILNENDPTVPRVDATTNPYHLVTIDRLALPVETTLHYRLVSDNEVLAVGELP